MNKIALIKKLKENNISDRYFCLNGGLPYDKICLEKNEDKWEVYYSEGKAKIGLMQFDNESEACQCMKEEVSTVMELIYGLKIVS